MAKAEAGKYPGHSHGSVDHEVKKLERARVSVLGVRGGTAEDRKAYLERDPEQTEEEQKDLECGHMAVMIEATV